jgi:Trk K+ transport system NAD-binding subunit
VRTVDCLGHLESADLIGADAAVASSGSDQVALMAGVAAVSY